MEIEMDATSFTKQRSPHHHQKKHTLIYTTHNLNHDIGTTLTGSFKNERWLAPDPRTELRKDNYWFCRSMSHSARICATAFIVIESNTPFTPKLKHV